MVASTVHQGSGNPCKSSSVVIRNCAARKTYIFLFDSRSPLPSHYLVHSVKVYCTTVCVSSATVVDDPQYVEQCECDSAAVVCPVHRSEPCDYHNWTTIGRKGKSKRPGRLPRLQASTLDGLGSNG